MTYPPDIATATEWKAWVDSVAPYRRPCHNELHSEMRFLTTIQDRDVAALGAWGIVASLMKRREIA